MTAGRAIATGLVALVVFALAILAGCSDDDCYETRTWRGTIDLPAEPRVEFQIDRCLSDSSQCLEVCRTAMASVSYERLDRCDVTVDGMQASVAGTYTNYIGGEGCAFMGPDALIVVVDAPPLPDAPVVVGPDANGPDAAP